MEDERQASTAYQTTDSPVLTSLRQEVEALKTQSIRVDSRLERIEQTVQHLAQEIRDFMASRTLDEKAVKPAAGQQASGMAEAEPDNEVDVEGVTSNWNYIVAKKGGYNHILYVTVQELFELGKDPVQFLSFLVQKRETEIRMRFEQLQAEHQKLQGSQLQNHFKDLWKSHYTLLKKKQARTWKEEIFLEAFDAFIVWLQS
jgi:hypothetical protein